MSPRPPQSSVGSKRLRPSKARFRSTDPDNQHNPHTPTLPLVQRALVSILPVVPPHPIVTVVPPTTTLSRYQPLTSNIGIVRSCSKLGTCLLILLIVKVDPIVILGPKLSDLTTLTNGFFDTVLTIGCQVIFQPDPNLETIGKFVSVDTILTSSTMLGTISFRRTVTILRKLPTVITAQIGRSLTLRSYGATYVFATIVTPYINRLNVRHRFSPPRLENPFHR